jgi:hypothetical protein
MSPAERPGILDSMSSLTWEELEAPVMRWALERGDDGTGELSTRDDSEFFAGIPELTESQVAEALKRLHQAGLVTGNGPNETSGTEEWLQVRPTADGLRVLGEWPPAEGATINVALGRILIALADSDQVSASEKTATRRAGTAVARTAGDTVLDIAKQEMARFAREAAS